MIDAGPLRCAVTILFGVSITMYAYLAVAQRDRWTCRVNHLLHLAMSVAMVSMVWRVGLGLPTIGPMLFFLLAGVWFVGAAVWSSSASRQRLKTSYYAAMMAAMAWMYAVMSGGVPGIHSPPDSAVMDMPGMRSPGPNMSSATTGSSWVAAANWLGVVGFAAVALYWAYRFVGERRMVSTPAAARLARMEPVYQAFTAAGTALMFDALIR
ncbi:hypothetical protein MMAN_43420 [Mycobacterium mantenii]|uniref:DUF5134 domain-containing protein n=1 Tax=Mycobacterium mantenii TaxID=560555 RepID=A0A1X0FZJ2_MYCNT|nr:DUF5134 domain-containing protein [Mycobacterium mantenii]MCV7241429.1 DUF5134 domain-containing protein [Mycobacterium mantenii]ORB06985.1 DUF5134 domain-containing protein [Mycobacterium mantenii]BBY40208.1 hypothetical protein MMAN_43420 [Mycobacterium mantenii]